MQKDSKPTQEDSFKKDWNELVRKLDARYNKKIEEVADEFYEKGLEEGIKDGYKKFQELMTSTDDMSNSQKVVRALLKYIDKHPEERFWQALLNFTDLPYIAISPRPPGEISHELEDTFYLDMKVNSKK